MASQAKKLRRLQNRKNELIGKKFGRLTILDFIEARCKGPTSRSTIYYWKTICECGTLRENTTSSLTSGQTKSCGCLLREVGKRNRFNDEQKSSLNNLFRRYIHRARKKKIEFTLSIEFFKIITKQNCYYCNIEPIQIIDVEDLIGTYTYNGIDRKNSKLGYIEENCVACCKNCNIIKKQMSVDEFKKYLLNYFLILKKKFEP